MTALVKCGNFDRSVTGNHSVTGLGFRPKGLLITTICTTTAAGFVSEAPVGVGITDGSASFCEFMVHHNAANRSGQRSGKILYVEDTGGTVIVDMTIVSMDADGFTVNLGTIGANTKFLWQAFGGNVNAKVLDVAGNNATGNQAITGVGFRPDLVIAIANYNDNSTTVTTAARYGFGVAARFFTGMGGGGAHALSVVTDTSGTVSKRTFESGAYLLMHVVNSAGTNIMAGSVTSFDSDGFTINQAVAIPATIRMPFLCIKGIGARVAVITEDSATGTKNYTGPNYRAIGLISCGIAHTAAGTGIANSSVSLGASDRPTTATPAQWCWNAAKTDGSAGISQRVQYTSSCANAHEISSSESIQQTQAGWSRPTEYTLNKNFGSATNQYSIATLVDLTQHPIFAGGD